MQVEWTRSAVWAEHDARHRARMRGLALLVGFGALTITVGLRYFSIYELFFP